MIVAITAIVATVAIIVFLTLVIFVPSTTPPSTTDDKSPIGYDTPSPSAPVGEKEGSVELRECYIKTVEYDISHAIGKLCESENECVDYVNELEQYYGPPAIIEDIKCEATVFVQIEKDDGSSYSCITPDDCFNRLIEPALTYQEVPPPSIQINEMKKLFRCTGGLCESTMGFESTWMSTRMGVVQEVALEGTEKIFCEIVSCDKNADCQTGPCEGLDAICMGDRGLCHVVG